MSTVIKIKRSTSGGSVPSNGSLAAGELAVNITNKKMWVGTGGVSDAPVLLVDYDAMIGGGVNTSSDNTSTTRYLVFSTAAQSSATLYVDDTTTPLTYNPSTAELTITGDLNVNGGDLKTTAATASLFDTNATTLTIGAAATSMTLGASTATINLGSGSTGATINVKGNLVVEGTTTTINSTTLTVDDKNIELGSVVSPSDTTADGGGITLKGSTDKTFNWIDSTDAWTSSEHLNIATGKSYFINGSSVLNSTTLGSGVTGSSLTSVGTLTSGTIGSGFTTVATTVGGTGLTSFTSGGAMYATSTSALTTGTLPVASGGTGITSFGTGVATWLGTPSSANLATAITDETGSGALVFANSPTLITPSVDAGTELRFKDSDSSNYVAFKSSATVAANNVYTLPAAVGTTNQVLSISSVAGNDATLAWATPSGGGGTKTYAIYNPLHNQPPAANYATLDTRNSIAVLEFDASAVESACFVGVMPEAASLGSGLKIRIGWMADTATSGDCVWGVQIERMNTDEDADSFDTAATATSTTNATSGIITTTEITITTIDSVAAGEPYRVKIYRDSTNGSDTMTGDAQLVVVEVRSAA